MSPVQPRRSGRCRTATTKGSIKLPNDTHLTGDEEEELDDSATQVTRNAKRRKTKDVSTKKTSVKKLVGSRKKGRLSALPEMPLDILFEILKYLEPLDLLRMARTTKDLRSVLMKGSALSVWKSARANVARLPDCPKSISEPAYANFMFTTNCHACLSPRAAHNFAARCVRYCKFCVDLKVMWEPFSRPDLINALPGGEAWADKLMYTYDLNKPNAAAARVWLQQDYDGLLKEYQQFPESNTKAEDFLELKKSTADDIGELEYEYREWLQYQEMSRAVQRFEARDERRQAIIGRLTDAGFGDDISGMSAWEVQRFRNHHMVKQSRPLSDRIWKNIEAAMIALMLTFRENLRKRERDEIISQRRKLFVQMLTLYEKERPVDDVIPSPADLYFLDSAIPLRQIIEESPNEEEITLEHFAEYKNQLPQICSEWKISMIPRLLLMMMNATGEKVDESVLHLAKTIFTCTFCDQSIFYPEVLAHVCLQELPSFDPIPADIPHYLTLIDLETAPWNENDALDYCEWRIDSASEVIDGCGFKSDTAKTVDLDAEKFWVFSFSGDSANVEVMDWRRAAKISHSCLPDEWHRISTPESNQCFDDAELKFYLTKTTAVCHCVHCKALLLSTHLSDHMSEHKTGPVERTDFYVHRDNPPACTFSTSILLN